MYVVFLYGPAASGKHTIGSRLSQLTGLPLFHNHLAVDAARALFDFGTPSFNRLRATIWRTAFSEAAQLERSFIFTFHPESSVEPGLVDALVQSVQGRGGRVHFIELACSRDTVLRRLTEPSRAAFGKLADPELYLALEARGAFEHARLPDPLAIISTEGLDPDAAALYLQEALLRAEGLADGPT